MRLSTGHIFMLFFGRNLVSARFNPWAKTRHCGGTGMIQVQGLTKDYGARRAIYDLTFNAGKCEILGFLGPNGAGKTTTMRILTGYLPPTFGTVTIAGLDLMEKSLEIRRIIGYLPESVPLYPDMTVFEYLKYMADLRHVKNSNQKVKEVLQKVNMQDRSSGYVGNLSKGMRQRIGLAQALVHDPQVLILDEPTIGLDPAQIIEVRDMIRELGKERTILLSTHILSEAQQICNRVLIINKGHIVTEDTPEILQSRLSGAQRVMVKVRGESDDVASLVASTPGVTLVLPGQNGELEFETALGEDVRSQVAKTIISAGFDLLEYHTISLSLEEIFLQLIREEESSLLDESSSQSSKRGKGIKYA
jgi:ABC-2 type transport system ATP-binding protein